MRRWRQIDEEAARGEGGSLTILDSASDAQEQNRVSRLSEPD